MIERWPHVLCVAPRGTIKATHQVTNLEIAEKKEWLEEVLAGGWCQPPHWIYIAGELSGTSRFYIGSCLIYNRDSSASCFDS